MSRIGGVRQRLDIYTIGVKSYFRYSSLHIASEIGNGIRAFRQGLTVEEEVEQGIEKF